MSALKRSLRIDLSRVQINTNKAVILHYLSTFQKILDFSRVFCYCRLSDNSNLGAEQSTPRNGGEGGTRTLAPVTRPTPLAGAPRHQLEYFCIGSVYDTIRLLKERAENPLSLLSGGESGIRTHGTLPYDGFQDRSVITTSVSLRIRRKL